MKVKELRNWLQDFGDQNKDHYHRAHGQRALSSSVSNVTRVTVPTVSKSHVSTSPDDAMLAIETKPSTASTSLSSSFEEEGAPRSNMMLAPSTTWDSDDQGRANNNNNNSNNNNHEAAFSFDDHNSLFDVSSKSSGSDSESSTPSKYYQSPPHETFDGMGHMGTQHVHLLRQHATPVFAVDNQDASQLELKVNATKIENGGSMHSANLLKDQILTKANLDVICQDGRQDESRYQNENGSVDSLAYSNDGDVSSFKSSVISDDSGTPSIVPGALVSKMAAVFLKDGSEEDEKTERGGLTGPQPVVTRKQVDPKDLSFLQPTPLPDKQPIEVQPRPRNTTVGRGIRKFGNSKTIVERRKEELSQKWAEAKPAVHIKKVQWAPSKNGGGYKKKVVVEKLYY